MHKFTIKVDLSRFFDDERRCAIVLVDPIWEKVEILQKHVEKIFNLKKVRFQTTEGCLVPAQESVEIVKYIDTLKVFSGKIDDEKNQLAKNAIKMVGGVFTEEFKDKKKRKFFSLETMCFGSSTPNNAKRSKNCTTNIVGAQEINNNSHEITSTHSDLNTIKENIESIVTDTTPSDITIKEQRVKSKKKKKNRNHSESAENNTKFDIEANNEINKSKTANEKMSSNCRKTKSSNFASSTLRTISKEKLDQTNVNSCHMYFNDTREIENACDETKTDINSKEQIKSNVRFHSVLSDLNTNNARVFPINTRRHTKVPIEIQELIIIKPSLVNETQQTNTCDASCSAVDDNKIYIANVTSESQASLACNKSTDNILLIKKATIASALNGSSIIAVNEEDNELEDELTISASVIDLNETEDANQSKANITNQSSSVDNITVEKILPLATNLVGLPDIGDILLFKYCFEAKLARITSNYIAGSCEYVNKRTKSIKLLIVDGKAEIENIPTKFSCNLDDTNDNNQYLNMKLTDMIDTKIFKMF